ncbi:hypothetical protein GCM10023107_86380 [Actinoplanes octamycinicus]|nr:hypothetical protein Aoc01nite_72780 [Actinoplanes octamycinicus]
MRRAVAVAASVAVAAALLPGPSYGDPPRLDPEAFCRAEQAAFCSVLVIDTDAPPPSVAGLAFQPVATRLAVDGVPGCVGGPGRPVVRTTTPRLSAAFDRMPGEVTFELVPLDGATEPEMIGVPVEPDRTAVAELDQLGPGESYRWRVRGTGLDVPELGWSPWCEFTVAAGLLDLRDATDLDAVLELGVDPARRYPVTLPARQWRLFLEIFDEPDEGPDDFDGGPGEASDRLRRIAADVREQLSGREATVTLTGDEWATAASELAGLAGAWDDAHDEDPQIERDGAAHWTVLDRISAQLGGPAHPGLGRER